MSVKIKLKHSSVANKAPLPADLAEGELALNINSTNPAAYIKDSAGVIRKIAGISTGAVTPATPTAGMAWLDTTVPTKPVFKVYDGTAWQGAGSGTSAGAAAPAAPAAGDLWVDTTVPTAPVLKVYNGTAFVTVTPDATTTTKGVVQLADAAAITAGTTGRVVDAAQLKAIGDADDWTRTGTTIAPRVAGDVVTVSAGTAALPGLTPVGDPNTGLFSAGADQVGLATNGVGRLLADATGGITIPALKSASVANVAVDINGKLIRQALPFAWDANDDSYSRVPVADRSILVQARMKRCLVTDPGVVTYLDADDSTKLAGDWVRLVETTALDTPYTGTHQAEQANTELRAMAPAWAAGTFTKGALATNGGFVWECVAATTTQAPAAGTAAATLSGTAGQVMVEIPLFSVKHQTERNGTYKRHEFAVVPGVQTTGGFAVHPAFIKPDGSYRNFIYIGAYQGTGTNGNGSASGVNNTANMTRAACRAACAGRGAGWHQLGYWENNALQWLLITEYQDVNSQRVLGNGAMSGAVYVVPTGLSNARGNRSGNAHTAAGANSDYVSYRGVENFYGRAWQWLDGINVNSLAVYLCNNPAQWADDTATNYTASGSVPSGSGSYQRDLMSGIALLPSSVTGASDTTYAGDALWTDSGWRVARAGGSANNGDLVGALCLILSDDSTNAYSSLGGRLAWS